jgi:serine phosphatase RsbU (regulator of sigma subunit)
MSSDESATLRARVGALEVANRRLREQLDSKAKVANRALAAYQQRVERLAETLSRLEERDRRISEDLEEARRFQALLLSLPTQLPGVTAASLYRPAEVVGGDVFDVSALPDGGVRVFLADATGHGVQAALRTMILKSEYDRLRAVVTSPAVLLETLSERLVANYPGLELRSTAACLDLVPGSATGETVLRYGSCAHPPLLLVEGDKVEELYRAGPFLGTTAGVRLELVERSLAAGAKIALYSDGLVEQWNDGGAAFGLGPLVEALRSVDPIDAALVALESRLVAFVGARGLSDDATALALAIE